MIDGQTKHDFVQFPDVLELANDGVWYARGHEDMGFLKQDDTYWVLIEENSFWYKHRSQLFVEVVSQYPPLGEIFEIGAGHGDVTIALQSSGYRTIAIEPTVSRARSAQGRGCKDVICATLENSGFKSGSLANVGMFDVLEHIPNDVEYLMHLRTLMKKGGRFYCAVPAHNFLWSEEDNYAGHCRRYSLADLSHKIELAGFEIEYGTYFFRPVVWPIFILRVLPTWLGFRKKRTAHTSQREHNLSSGMASRIISNSLDKELKLISNGVSIRFGASCLMVAKAT